MTQRNETKTTEHRRAVLRVLHEVDERGKIIAVQLEPLPDAPHDDVAYAAYHAARRCHPWIVGDDTIAKADAEQRALRDQLRDLLRAFGQFSWVLDHPVPKPSSMECERGYRLAIEELRACDEFLALHSAAGDVRRLMAATLAAGQGRDRIEPLSPTPPNPRRP